MESNGGRPIGILLKRAEEDGFENIADGQTAAKLCLGFGIALDPSADALPQPFFMTGQGGAESLIILGSHRFAQDAGIGLGVFGSDDRSTAARRRVDRRNFIYLLVGWSVVSHGKLRNGRAQQIVCKCRTGAAQRERMRMVNSCRS